MSRAMRVFRSAVTIPVILLATLAAHQLHAKVLPTGLIDLFLVMLFAFRWGFLESAVAASCAVLSLDFLFMPPIYSFFESDPQDWISSAVFAAASIFVGHQVDRLRGQARQNEEERKRMEQLYLTSRDVIMIERNELVGARLAKLIQEVFTAKAVAIWNARQLRMDRSGNDPIVDEDVKSAYLNDRSHNDPSSSTFSRVLRIGVKPIGALYISGADRLDSRSADALSSLASLAIERANSFAEESEAEAGRRTEQLRSAILDGLAHAFKTPLATIQNASSGLLELAAVAGVERELASIIGHEAERLSQLTDRALRTAELDETSLTIRWAIINPNAFLSKCRDTFASEMPDHPIVLEESAYGLAKADPDLLQIALFQFVDNAAKYATPGSPILLSASSSEAETVFSVHNQGSYLSPREALHVFERFYRSPEAKFRASGTGIGLSVTKRIVHALQGRVWVESDPVTGTTFNIGLPKVRKGSLRERQSRARTAR